MAEDGLTRREVLAAGLVLAGCVDAVAPRPGDDAMKTSSSARMPVVYLPHGGGPWPFVEVGFGDPASWEGLASYLRELAGITRDKPRAVLCVSAHWEEDVATVTTSPRPPMLYDYYGFPAAAYAIKWPAPGDPNLAARVRALLDAAGIASADDPERGFDHGAFVPLKLTYPDADVPTIQLSLLHSLDPAAHLRIGRALAPLRDEGVLIVGSGMSYHSMRAFKTQSGAAESAEFDTWLRETVAMPAAERDARLTAWENAPRARACHPREEHLLPLMVIAGAAGEDKGTVPFADIVMGAHVSAAHFG